MLVLTPSLALHAAGVAASMFSPTAVKANAKAKFGDGRHKRHGGNRLFNVPVPHGSSTRCVVFPERPCGLSTSATAEGRTAGSKLVTGPLGSLSLLRTPTL